MVYGGGGWRGKFYIDNDVNCSGITLEGVVGCVGLRTLPGSDGEVLSPADKSYVYYKPNPDLQDNFINSLSFLYGTPLVLISVQLQASSFAPKKAF